MNTVKLIRYQLGRKIAYGVIEDDQVFALLDGPFGSLARGRRVAGLDEVTLLAPCEPTKIVAVGRNYAAHAAELGNDIPTEPLIFLKPPSAVVGQGASIVYPGHLSERVDHEGELVLVIGRTARHVRREDAMDYVLGLTCGNDVTARDLQRRDTQWTRAKGFDTFCPLGPWIVLGPDVRDLAVRCTVNGVLRQDGRTSQLIFPPDELIAYISAVMTLGRGDVILTGTPAGVGPLRPGDRVAVDVEGVGVLWNDVVAAV
jgi:2-keto-4-pentenoate hydratase/2-oxohepta-3-ene-1,7-dioic acid hydratase in catechol pathway